MIPIAVRTPPVISAADLIEPHKLYQPKTSSTAPIQYIALTQTTNDSISSVGLVYLVNLNNQTPEKPSFLSSGIPKTPKQVILHVQNSDDVDE